LRQTSRSCTFEIVNVMPNHPSASRAPSELNRTRSDEFTVAARPFARRLNTFLAATLMLGVICFPQASLLWHGSRVPASWPTDVAFAGLAIFAAARQVLIASRLYTVLRVSGSALTIESSNPPFRRTYAWTELRFWATTFPRIRRGTLRIELNDGTVITLYPREMTGVDRLLRRLESLER